MKNLLFISLCVLGTVANGQLYYEFTYDDSGNRVKREYIDLSFPDDPGPEGPENDDPEELTSGDQADKNLTAEKGDPLTGVNLAKNDPEMAMDRIGVYPNPTEGILLLSIRDFVADDKGEWLVISPNGKIIAQSSELEAEILIDLSTAATGRYILKLRMGEENKEWVIVKR